MGAGQKTPFSLDKIKCNKCCRYINTCSGVVLSFGQDGSLEMQKVEQFCWRGWKC